LGATIDEIDLREPLKAKEVEFIKQSLAEHEVIFFRNQDISPEQHRTFAFNFGLLQSHPVYPTVKGFPEITILENDEDNPSKIEEWHTDMTFRKIPPLGSILLGKIIPQEGGDTLFSSLSAAFSGLTNEMKNSLENEKGISFH
jgi:taurine dioxygenase